MKQEDRYTIGVWEDDVLLAICHDACLDSALVAIRREMEGGRATLLFGHPTKAKRLETSEPSDLAGKTERERHVRLPHRPHSDKNLGYKPID